MFRAIFMSQGAFTGKCSQSSILFQVSHHCDKSSELVVYKVLVLCGTCDNQGSGEHSGLRYVSVKNLTT